MQKRLKIFVQGEYRRKRSKDDVIIKDYETNLILEVKHGNSLIHELRKDDRLLKHVRKNIDEYCSSIRTIHIIKSHTDIAIEAGISVEHLETADRETLIAFIKQEELPIEPTNYKLRTQLLEAVMDYITSGNEPTANKPAITEILPDAGNEEREDDGFIGEEDGELDDRGLPTDDIDIDSLDK